MYVLIFIKVFHLLENCYFVFKMSFCAIILGQEYHFNNIFYNSLGINSLEKLSNFLGKGVILVVNSEKNNNLFWKCKFFGYVSFTGKSENLAETAILKDFFIFVANGHHFQKC